MFSSRQETAIATTRLSVTSASNEVAIRVNQLGKCFNIFDNPRDRLKQFIAPRVQRLIGTTQRQYFREFWALRDISFEIKKGETVGIIGRNGSGKSTLLQLICGTLTPTTGVIETNGRVAALLELGSGFNPEFTGRENIYLNAAVLGLSKEEVDQRFDRIAGFADIGEFIEQPVKTYSSGMQVRLAFAVIAHVDADILVVDEALSVGDAVFTQKCMRFIRSFQEKGTLLFVSHDMSSVQNLCKSAVWLGHGQLKTMGPTKEVAQAYLQYTLQEIYGDAAKLAASNTALDSADEFKEVESQVDYGAQAVVHDNIENASGWKTGGAEVISVRLEGLDRSSESVVFEGGERVQMVVTARANQPLLSPILGFLVRDRLGQDLFGENTLPFTAKTPRAISAGEEFSARFIFRLPMLSNGQYAVMASVADGDLYNNVQHHFLHDALIINVSSSKVRWGLVGVPFEQITLEVQSG